jgi:PPOX class probable F420-dependent enzyme
MDPIPNTYLDLFEKPSIATVTTLLPDGSPHSTPIWIDYDGEYLQFVTRKDTQKYANLTRDPRVALTTIDPEDPNRYLAITGEVAERTEEGALAFSDEQASRYWDVEQFPYARQEPRSLVSIRPERVDATRIPTP